MKYEQIDIEYRLDNYGCECEYIEDLGTITNAKKVCKKLQSKYGKRLEKLEILCYIEGALEQAIPMEHIL